MTKQVRVEYNNQENIGEYDYSTQTPIGIQACRFHIMLDGSEQKYPKDAG